MAKIIRLPTHSDDRGQLTVLEDNLDFKMERIYWIYGANISKRGGHRHHVTRQALICVAGRCEVEVIDLGKQTIFELDNPSICLIVAPEEWHTMSFSPGAVLVVVASHRFDPDDYIDTPRLSLLD